MSTLKNQHLGPHAASADMERPFISTATGDYTLTGDLSQNKIDIGDLAGSLSLLNRFTGHGDQTGRAALALYKRQWRMTAATPNAMAGDLAARGTGWSVAQHSLLCMKLGENQPRAFRLALLIHDLHEALVGDVSSPVKAALGAVWREFEAAHEAFVHQALGFTKIMRHYKPAVRDIDLIALRIERHVFFGEQAGRKPWQIIDGASAEWTKPTQYELDALESIRTQTPTPDQARNLFLVWYKALSVGAAEKANP